MKYHILLLLCAALGLTSCATKTDPGFLRNASASLFGGEIIGPDGSRAFVPAAPKRNGFDTFYGGSAE